MKQALRLEKDWTKRKASGIYDSILSRKRSESHFPTVCDSQPSICMERFLQFIFNNPFTLQIKTAESSRTVCSLICFSSNL